ncbi:MAG: hypothetical protein HKN14_02325 [Marinicaulis sp.]|nr:hypothetical protein [Marinicaulis sp.]NNE39735.1 hypothetical protein [Marinicaulis sp.]NNL88773.1 hypothetical protein [Marinicaulis sp.]
MGAVTTLVASVAAAAGAVAFYRFVDRQRREYGEIFGERRSRTSSRENEKVIDYERDPQSGVFKPKQ